MARKRNGTHSKQGALNITQDCTALYVRVSTDLQVTEGYSLDAQRERMIAYCTAQQWNVCLDHVYIDAGESGKSTDRPAYQAMIDAVDAGSVNRIVVTKLDRLSRNTKDFLTLLDYCNGRNVGIVSIAENFDTGTAIGRAVVTVLMAFSELERTAIKERVQSGKLQKARQGGYNGSKVPFGYTYQNGQWAIDETQAAIVRRIFAAFNAGGSLRGIAADVGMPHTSVRYALGNGLYAGLAQWDGIETDGSAPAIIDRATYEAAERRLQNLKRGNPNFGKM